MLSHFLICKMGTIPFKTQSASQAHTQNHTGPVGERTLYTIKYYVNKNYVIPLYYNSKCKIRVFHKEMYVTQ